MFKSSISLARLVLLSLLITVILSRNDTNSTIEGLLPQLEPINASERTAVTISGQLRSANLTIMSR